MMRSNNDPFNGHILTKTKDDNDVAYFTVGDPFLGEHRLVV
jgi:hypothetical protein